MSDNPFHLVETKPEPNESVLAVMRDVMQKVESGEVVSIVVVGVTKSRGERGYEVLTGIGGNSEPMLMLGGLQCMITKVQKWWVEE